MWTDLFCVRQGYLRLSAVLMLSDPMRLHSPSVQK